jgi:putative sporulation protein YtaF
MDFAMTKLDLLPILLLAISSNGDNVAVGIAYGLGRIDVPLPSNFLIAIVTGAGTLASMWLGQAIGSVMDPRLASAAGGVLVVAVGGWVILQSIRAKTVGKSSRILTMNSEQGRSVGPLGKLMLVLKNPAGVDADLSRSIELKESWMLAIALSLNNVVNGLAAGMLRMDPGLTTLLVMVFSVLTLSAGLAAGYQVGKRWLGSLSGLLSGLALVALGLYEIHA